MRNCGFLRDLRDLVDELTVQRDPETFSGSGPGRVGPNGQLFRRRPYSLKSLSGAVEDCLLAGNVIGLGWRTGDAAGACTWVPGAT